MIEKPTKEVLAELIDQACENQTEEEWIEKFLSGIKGLLSKSPARYRGYGPYWWLIKKALIDKGEHSFGEHIDAEWFETMDYGDTAFNLAAAYLYEDMRTDSVNLFDDAHYLSDEAGETVIFNSSAEDMEIRGRDV